MVMVARAYTPDHPEHGMLFGVSGAIAKGGFAVKTWPCCLALAAGCLSVTAVADTAIADTLSYEFLGAESELVVTGGFAGVNESYAVEGSFDLDIDPAADTASFSSVDTVLHGRGSFNGSSLNDVLNMELLTGTVVNATTIQFTGRESQDLEVSLEAVLGDDSLQLTGGNVLECCDRFSYELIAAAVVVPQPPIIILGDVDGDGEVNGLDVDPFVDVLLSGLYQVEADMNEDQVVNGLDVDPFVAAVVGGGVQAVPEPSSWIILVIGALLLGYAARRQR
jgi:hypothetical protein